MDRRQIVDAVRRAVDRCGDVGEAAARLGVRPSTLSKVLQGRKLSPQAHQKLITQLSTPGVLQEPSNRGNARLETVHRLYLELGTLQAAAERLNLTRERVRQLLVKGTRLGLFEYKPRDYPFIERSKILSAYSHTLSRSRTAQELGISSAYLRKLLTAYSIGDKPLSTLRRRAKKAQCISNYRLREAQLGRPPTTADLQATAGGHTLHMKILRLWGSIDAFREELSIPAPPKGSRTFRDDTAAWREHQRRIAFVTRMQHLDEVRECLGSGRALSTGAIAEHTQINSNRVRFLLGLLVGAGEVINEGTGSASRYRLVPTGREA